MHPRHLVFSALAASVLSLFTPKLMANATLTWTPNLTGPYGLNFSSFQTVNGTFVTANGGIAQNTFDFGDGANASLRAGLILDTRTSGGLSLTSTMAYLFTANGYTLRSTTEPVFYNDGVTFSVSPNVTATFSATASGTFTKIGNGTLQLDQPFTGSALSINEGTLATLAPLLVNNSSLTTAAGATFALGASNQSLLSITNNGTITSTGGALTTPTLLNNGTINSSSSVPGALDGDLTVGGLNGSGNITLNNNFLFAGVDAAQIDTYTGNLSGNGSLLKAGASELILLGNTSLAGARTGPGITVQGGTLAGNTNSLTGTIDVLPGSTLLFAQSANGTFSGSLAANGTVLANGLNPATVLTFTAPNPFTGNLHIGANLILAVSADNQLGSVTTVQNNQKILTFSAVTFDGGTLRTTTAFSSSRPYTFTQNGGTLDTDALSPTFTGAFTSTGNGTFTITGGGAATFSNALSLNALAVNHATVALTNNTISNSTLTLASTATALALTGANLTLTGYSATAAGAVSILDRSTLTLNHSTFQSGSVSIATVADTTDSAALAGPNATWSIIGDLTLGKDAVLTKPFSTPAGIGSLSIPAFDTASVTGTTTLLANSTLAVAGRFSTGALTNSAGSTPTIAISDFIVFPVSPAFILGGDTAANTAYSGTLTNGGTPGGIHKVGANTQTLLGTDTYSGSTLIDDGTLVIGSNTALPAASLITNNATLSIAAPDVTANILSGTGALTIHSLDHLTLTGAGASKQSGLTVPLLSSLDIGAHPFILEATPATKEALLSQMTSDVASSRTIFSSTVAANPTQLALAVVDNAALPTPFTSLDGQSVDATSILITPALLGDSNLDGHVDLTDLNTVLNHLGTPTPSWTDGNFDHAPTIDLTDLNAVLNHLGLTFANPTQLPITIYQLPVSPTPAPEPASLAVLLTLLPPLLTRSRRRTVFQRN